MTQSSLPIPRRGPQPGYRLASHGAPEKRQVLSLVRPQTSRSAMEPGKQFGVWIIVKFIGLVASRNHGGGQTQNFDVECANCHRHREMTAERLNDCRKHETRYCHECYRNGENVVTRKRKEDHDAEQVSEMRRRIALSTEMRWRTAAINSRRR